jgi:hypothetical protein
MNECIRAWPNASLLPNNLNDLINTCRGDMRYLLNNIEFVMLPCSGGSQKITTQTQKSSQTDVHNDIFTVARKFFTFQNNNEKNNLSVDDTHIFKDMIFHNYPHSLTKNRNSIAFNSEQIDAVSSVADTFSVLDLVRFGRDNDDCEHDEDSFEHNMTLLLLKNQFSIVFRSKLFAIVCPQITFPKHNVTHIAKRTVQY